MDEVIVNAGGVFPLVRLVDDNGDTRCTVEVKVNVVRLPVTEADLAELVRRVTDALHKSADVIELKEGL